MRASSMVDWAAKAESGNRHQHGILAARARLLTGCPLHRRTGRLTQMFLRPFL